MSRVNKKLLEELEARLTDLKRVSLVIIDKKTEEILKTIRQDEDANIKIVVKI